MWDRWRSLLGGNRRRCTCPYCFVVVDLETAPIVKGSGGSPGRDLSPLPPPRPPPGGSSVEGFVSPVFARAGLEAGGGPAHGAPSLDPTAQLRLVAAQHGVAAERVERPSLANLREPGRGIVGDAAKTPMPDGLEQGFLNDVLDQVEPGGPEGGRKCRDEPPRLVSKEVLEQAVGLGLIRV